MRRKRKNYIDKAKRSHIGKALQQIRIQRGLTAQELADAIECSKVTVGLFEAGQQFPTVERLYKLADFYKIQVSSIFKLADALQGMDGKETNLQMRQLIQTAYYEKENLPKRLKRA